MRVPWSLEAVQSIVVGLGTFNYCRRLRCVPDVEGLPECAVVSAAMLDE